MRKKKRVSAFYYPGPLLDVKKNSDLAQVITHQNKIRNNNNNKKMRKKLSSPRILLTSLPSPIP